MKNNIQASRYQFTWVDNNAQPKMGIAAAGAVVVTGSPYNMALKCQ